MSDAEASGLPGILIDCGPCPYLPDRQFRAMHLLAYGVDNTAYRLLLDHNFRRNGTHFYRPQCEGCDACQALRVDVAAFAPRHDQRRCTKRNADLNWSWQPRGFDAERAALYHTYQDHVHDDPPGEETDPRRFLVESGEVDGGEIHIRDGNGRLLAVSVCDRIGDSLSSVYCYFDPLERRRSLGTFAVLCEIAFCREQGLRWLYLGFHVRGCRKMIYKARFMPCEIRTGGGWQRLTESPPTSP